MAAEAVAEHADVLTAARGVETIVTHPTTDGAFVSAKRGRCGAVSASAADLKTVADGLQRDGTRYRLSSLWFAPAEIQGASDAIKSERSVPEKQRTECQRQQAEDVKIPAMRAALRGAEAGKAVLEAELAAAEAPALRLMPNPVGAYGERVAVLQEALADEDAAAAL